MGGGSMMGRGMMGAGACQVVEGRISPMGYCDLYVPCSVWTTLKRETRSPSYSRGFPLSHQPSLVEPLGVASNPGFEPTLRSPNVSAALLSICESYWCASALRAEALLQASVPLNVIALRCSVSRLCRSLFDRADL